ncbi:outer membrane protein assembly factor BamD [Rubrimonas cliftonensis]|uniref:Outer membrane protein assembly factor BamD n=1 Tax=Rubrimonas cliftonensis TaxID=89524 RepID=A0A1H3VXN6_9RHOB|nr:outer membrane protein assembly factor BamD [Rubrimonas cliftonensis]SDZ78852.1 Beta-barrel assembly machine subunit BamD [Rubrimonas cliftonensis]
MERPPTCAARAKTFRLAAVLAAALGVASCGDDEIPIELRSAEAIVAEADALAAEGEPLQAAALYDEIERLYPYSQLAKTSILRGAEAYYQGGAYDQARLAAERFLAFYPADPAAARAQYLIANTWYDQIVDVGRDQGATREALAALREVVNRYPDTEYAREAQLKLDLTQDHLAGKEMEIGRYYLKNQHYVAAINRFRAVVEDYQTTSHTPEALHRLVEAYLRLGVVGEAQTAAAVLGENFPGSTWYASSFDLLTGANTAPRMNSNSWLARSWRQVVLGEWL